MKKTIFAILIVVIIFSFTVNSYANIAFSVHVQQTKDKQDSDKKIYQEKKEYDLSVDIGDRYFSFTQGDICQIYDFAAKRIFTIALLQKMYFDDSLFSTIGFRTIEFQNRLMMDGALKAAKIKEFPTEPVFIEHLFSLQQKEKKSEVSQTLKDGFLHFSSEGKELLSYSAEGEEVSRENKIMFIKFFRYVFAGHPQILEKLSSDNLIPKSIYVNQFDLSLNNTDVLTISAVKSTPDMPYSLDTYSPGLLSKNSDRFTKALHDITYSKTIDLKSHLVLLQINANIYFQNGNYLDAMLAYLEYYLASGLPFPATYLQQKTVLDKDDDVKKLLGALRPKSKIDAEAYLAIFQGLEEKAKYKGHILKIFKANVQIGLGKQQKATDLFYEVIKASPLITGVYIDLGQLFFKEYEAFLAWRCWDVARKIAPKHNMLSQINELESNLYKNYPEYF